MSEGNWKDKTGASIVLISRISGMIFAIYAAWYGHWLSALILVVLAKSLVWKKDGKFLPEETEL